MDIVGHQKILNFFKRSIEKNAISHAYIFSGPSHLGKFNVALDFAQKITGSNIKINPDIIIICPEVRENKGISKEEDIKIEKVRDFIHQLGTTSYSGKYKVGIIDKAEKMNKSAQNALLKSLEEPMDNVVIVLVASNLEKLLSTIKSRCILKKFSLVPDLEIENMLGNAENKNDILFWSLGRPGLAKKLMENKEEVEKRQEARKELSELCSLNISERISLAEKMSKDTPALIEKLDWWLVSLRDSILGGKENFLFSRNKLLSLIDKIEESAIKIKETNSNPKLVIENLLIEF